MSAVPNIPLSGGDPLYAPTPAPDAPQPVRFADNGGAFLNLLMRGAFLELVTFGFYRFWLATDIRKRLWGATSLGGDAFEYTGRARELFIGFLIALAIIGPLAVVNFLLGIYAEKFRAFASLPLALFYFAFSQFALYRARRYRLTRTIWRGVRFWMSGSGWRYAWKSFWWAMLVVASAGIAYPWRAAALERYKLGNSYYGDLQGSFAGTGGGLFKRVWWIWLLAMGPLVLSVGAFIALLTSGNGFRAALAASGALNGAQAPDDGFYVFAAGLSSLAGLALFAIWFLAYPLFRASEWQWWASGVRFGGLSVSSSVRRRSVLWLYVKTMLMSGLVLTGIGIALVFVGSILVFIFNLNSGAFLRFGRGGLQFSSYLGLAGIVFGYLTLVLAALVVQRFYLQHEMWRLISGSLTITGLKAAANVAARGEAANAIGEGLADGLDVAGF
jgi:uncharacterized membrane protein YjgN (DUF898 family)